MKRILIVLCLLTFLHVFAVKVFFGEQLIFESPEGKYLRWEEFVDFVKDYLERMGFETPVTGSVGNFNYIVWNGHTIGFDSSSKFLSLDGVSKRSDGVDLFEALRILGIPFVLEEDRLILPSMWIYDIQKLQDIIDVSYGGQKKLRVVQDDRNVYLLSDGYVYYAGVLYEPGRTLIGFERAPNESVKQEIDLGGLMRLVISKELKVSGVRVLKLEENVTINPSELTLLYASGDNRVIIRPYVPEYDGADWPIYAELRRLAEKLCREFSLKLEICPLIVLPPQTMSMLVLVEEDALIFEMQKFLEEIVK